MANPHRGTVSLQAGDRAYLLSFSLNALCELEDALDKPVAEIITSIQDPKRMRLGSIRSLLWAALRDHHPDVTLEQAGEIATDSGIKLAGEKIGEAVKLAFPEPSREAKKASQNPPEAVNG